MSLNSQCWLCFNRTVRFGDADPAGVIHFYQLFRWCHETWELSLENYGLSSDDIFPKGSESTKNPLILLPIINCEANFYLPIMVGETLDIELVPKRINPVSFQVEFIFKRSHEKVAFGLIKHMAIDRKTRQRCLLPELIDRWLEASSLNIGISSLE